MARPSATLSIYSRTDFLPQGAPSPFAWLSSRSTQRSTHNLPVPLSSPCTALGQTGPHTASKAAPARPYARCWIRCSLEIYFPTTQRCFDLDAGGCPRPTYKPRFLSGLDFCLLSLSPSGKVPPYSHDTCASSPWSAVEFSGGARHSCTFYCAFAIKWTWKFMVLWQNY